MKERVLKLDLDRAVAMLSTRKWNFYSVDRDRQIVKIEAPVHSDESWVVELTYDDENELKGIQNELDSHEFVEQTIRFIAE